MAVKKKQLLKSAKISESYISMGLGLLVVIILGLMILNFVKGRSQKLTLPGIQTPPPEAVRLEQPEKQVPTTHTVATNESLWTIAQRYYNSGYKWVKIAQINNLANPDILTVGQELVLPEDETVEPQKVTLTTTFGPAIMEDTYKVQKGDSLWKISVRAYSDGYQWTKIATANSLTNPNIIHAGNELIIPR